MPVVVWISAWLPGFLRLLDELPFWKIIFEFCTHTFSYDAEFDCLVVSNEKCGCVFDGLFGLSKGEL